MTPRLKPQLVKEWSHTRNIGIDLETIAPFSLKEVWWQCEIGHEWETTVFARSKGASCIYCSGRELLKGFNDMETLYPEISKLWSVSKNNGLLPKDILGIKSSFYWWKLDCGHEVLTTLNNRVCNKGCGVCTGRQVSVGVNDLATTHPRLALEWHPARNGDLTPEKVTAGARTKVWWQCTENPLHEWETILAARSKGKRNCPVCSNRKLVKSVNDLATTDPVLSLQWHPTKNGNLTPEDVVAGSRTKTWWLCDKGHEWEAGVGHRTAGFGCPFCSNLKLLPGFNDLASTHPDLAKEWDIDKNDISVDQVSKGLRKRAWWICPKGHSWEGSIDTRVADAANCPTCYTSNHSSKGETEIYEFLLENNLNVVRRDRKTLRGKELDLYIPSHNFAIEFNGLYWHSEALGKTSDYHYDKWLAAKKEGIQLIQIWEDDWNSNRTFIKKSLSHKLGLKTSSLNVYARKTHITLPQVKEVKTFFNENHIQGYASGSYYLCLRNFEEEMVASMILKKRSNGDLEIVRYATNNNVIGGFSKLLSYVEKNYVFNNFVTFSDHCISDGGLYERNGFIADKELAPDYMYLVGNKRVHKFNYRLKRFKTDPTLLWNENLSERELANLNKLFRIWDAGKTRWVRRNSIC